MAKKAQHVVPSSGAWAVRKSGAARTTSIHATQAEAIEAAIRIARNQQTELYIHGVDGRIRERSTYDKDPVPSEG